jgi:SH3 domain protein
VNDPEGSNAVLRWTALVFLGFELLAPAQTRYISDRTIVELRRGPSIEYLIVRNLEAGERVEVLEQNADQGTRGCALRTRGTEGWILTRLLTAEPIARDRLATAERNLAAARERVTGLEVENRELTSALATARAELEQARTSQSSASRELADIRTAAANVVQIRDDNSRPSSASRSAIATWSN